MGKLLALLVVLPLVAHAEPLTETQKIEALISSIENLKDAVFIRNGSTHDAKSAAKHLRDKWNHARKEIKTARAFIVGIGSFSSMSGKPYLIRFADGREQSSAEFLSRELGRLEAK